MKVSSDGSFFGVFHPCFYYQRLLDPPLGEGRQASRQLSDASTPGCVVECWICNWDVAGSNLGRGYFAPPKSTQPSIPLGSVNEYQLRLGRQKQVSSFSLWMIRRVCR